MNQRDLVTCCMRIKVASLGRRRGLASGRPFTRRDFRDRRPAVVTPRVSNTTFKTWPTGG
jgi:hypothetical protein